MAALDVKLLGCLRRRQGLLIDHEAAELSCLAALNGKLLGCLRRRQGLLIDH